MYFNYKKIQNKTKLEVASRNSDIQLANFVIVQKFSIHFQFLQSFSNEYKQSYTS